jgi:uncharacterized membrane protein
MDDMTIARALHIIAIIAWIGGVFMVTMVILPAVRKLADPEDQIRTFEEIEGRFAFQAKFLTLLAAITGAYMLSATNSWDRYLDLENWWLHAMTVIWFMFTMILFVIEPLFLHKFFIRKAKSNPDLAFKLALRLHQFMLTISLITVFGGIVGVHGW